MLSHRSARQVLEEKQHVEKSGLGLPTRLFHWALAACVDWPGDHRQIGGATIDWHARIGYAVLALLLFRLVSAGGRLLVPLCPFIYSPGSVINHLKGRPTRTT